MVIVQISDFHVVSAGQLAYGRIDTGAMLARAVTAINRLDPQPDLVIGSGDLVQSGDPAEYAALRAILADLRAPFLPAVANHDRRSALREAFAALDLVFGPGPFVQYAVDREDLRVVVLDTVTEGSDAASFCEQRAEWLDETLGAANVATLIVTHHPLFLTGVPWMDPPNLDWAGRLEGVVVRRRDRPIGFVSGHIHRAIHAHFAGVTASSCPSTAHQVALDFNARTPRLSNEAPGFQLHRWNGEDLITYTASLERFGEDFAPAAGPPVLYV